MRLPFLRKAASSGEPLVLAMTGARLGEAVLFVGSSRQLALPLAARVGLSGRCVVAGAAAASLEARATAEGVLVEPAPDVPADRSFDLAVVETEGDWARLAARALGAVRPGGRIVVIAAAPRTGLLSRLTSAPDPPAPADGIVANLTAAGWLRARDIGQRDGLMFVEAFARHG